MPDSVLLALVAALVLALAWSAERRERREGEMEKALEELDGPVIREAEPAGRKFERRFVEDGAEWEPIEEPLVLRVLACSFYDVPRVIEKMKKGEPIRTRFAEYRLVG